MHATPDRGANDPQPCDCWGATPWGTWEKKTSAPCPHRIKTTITYTDSRNTGWNRA